MRICLNLSTQRGSAITELIITLPILCLMYTSIFILGEKLFILGAASQTAFNTALYAAGASQSTGESEAHILGMNLLSSSVKQEKLSNRNVTINYYSTTNGPKADMVTVTVTGLMNGFPVPSFYSESINAQVAMPLLNTPVNTNVGDGFANPDTLYGENGQPR